MKFRKRKKSFQLEVAETVFELGHEIYKGIYLFIYLSRERSSILSSFVKKQCEHGGIKSSNALTGRGLIQTHWVGRYRTIVANMLILSPILKSA